MAGEMAAIRKELIAEKVKKIMNWQYIALLLPHSIPRRPKNGKIPHVRTACLTHCVYRQKNRVTLTAQLVETKKKLEQSEVLLACAIQIL